MTALVLRSNYGLYLTACLEGGKETTRTRQYSRAEDRKSNTVPLGYKAGILTTVTALMSVPAAPTLLRPIFSEN